MNSRLRNHWCIAFQMNGAFFVHKLYLLQYFYLNMRCAVAYMRFTWKINLTIQFRDRDCILLGSSAQSKVNLRLGGKWARRAGRVAKCSNTPARGQRCALANASAWSRGLGCWIHPRGCRGVSFFFALFFCDGETRQWKALLDYAGEEPVA